MKSWLIGDHQADASESAELRAAYERGRRDERARRRRRPALSVVVLGSALVGGAALALAALQGSFETGGALMDHQIATAAGQAEPVLRSAADQAGDAIRGMGQEFGGRHRRAGRRLTHGFGGG